MKDARSVNCDDSSLTSQFTSIKSASSDVISVATTCIGGSGSPSSLLSDTVQDTVGESATSLLDYEENREGSVSKSLTVAETSEGDDGALIGDKYEGEGTRFQYDSESTTQRYCDSGSRTEGFEYYGDGPGNGSLQELNQADLVAVLPDLGMSSNETLGLSVSTEFVTPVKGLTGNDNEVDVEERGIEAGVSQESEVPGTGNESSGLEVSVADLGEDAARMNEIEINETSLLIDKRNETSTDNTVDTVVGNTSDVLNCQTVVAEESEKKASTPKSKKFSAWVKSTSTEATENSFSPRRLERTLGTVTVIESINNSKTSNTAASAALLKQVIAESERLSVANDLLSLNTSAAGVSALRKSTRPKKNPLSGSEYVILSNSRLSTGYSSPEHGGEVLGYVGSPESEDLTANRCPQKSPVRSTLPLKKITCDIVRMEAQDLSVYKGVSEIGNRMKSKIAEQPTLVICLKSLTSPSSHSSKIPSASTYLSLSSSGRALKSIETSSSSGKQLESFDVESMDTSFPSTGSIHESISTSFPSMQSESESVDASFPNISCNPESINASLPCCIDTPSVVNNLIVDLKSASFSSGAQIGSKKRGRPRKICRPSVEATSTAVRGPGRPKKPIASENIEIPQVPYSDVTGPAAGTLVTTKCNVIPSEQGSKDREIVSDPRSVIPAIVTPHSVSSTAERECETLSETALERHNALSGAKFLENISLEPKELNTPINSPETTLESKKLNKSILNNCTLKQDLTSLTSSEVLDTSSSQTVTSAEQKAAPSDSSEQNVFEQFAKSNLWNKSRSLKARSTFTSPKPSVEFTPPTDLDARVALTDSVTVEQLVSEAAMSGCSSARSICSGTLIGRTIFEQSESQRIPSSLAERDSVESTPMLTTTDDCLGPPYLGSLPISLETTALPTSLDASARPQSVEIFEGSISAGACDGQEFLKKLAAQKVLHCSTALKVLDGLAVCSAVDTSDVSSIQSRTLDRSEGVADLKSSATQGILETDTVKDIEMSDKQDLLEASSRRKGGKKFGINKLSNSREGQKFIDSLAVLISLDSSEGHRLLNTSVGTMHSDISSSQKSSGTATKKTQETSSGKKLVKSITMQKLSNSSGPPNYPDPSAIQNSLETLTTQKPLEILSVTKPFVGSKRNKSLDLLNFLDGRRLLNKSASKETLNSLPFQHPVDTSTEQQNLERLPVNKSLDNLTKQASSNSSLVGKSVIIPLKKKMLKNSSKKTTKVNAVLMQNSFDTSTVQMYLNSTTVPGCLAVQKSWDISAVQEPLEMSVIQTPWNKRAGPKVLLAPISATQPGGIRSHQFEITPMHVNNNNGKDKDGNMSDNRKHQRTFSVDHRSSKQDIRSKITDTASGVKYKEAEDSYKIRSNIKTGRNDVEYVVENTNCEKQREWNGSHTRLINKTNDNVKNNHKSRDDRRINGSKNEASKEESLMNAQSTGSMNKTRDTEIDEDVNASRRTRSSDKRLDKRSNDKSKDDRDVKSLITATKETNALRSSHEKKRDARSSDQNIAKLSCSKASKRNRSIDSSMSSKPSKEARIDRVLRDRGSNESLNKGSPAKNTSSSMRDEPVNSGQGESRSCSREDSKRSGRNEMRSVNKTKSCSRDEALKRGKGEVLKTSVDSRRSINKDEAISNSRDKARSNSRDEARSNSRDEARSNSRDEARSNSRYEARSSSREQTRRSRQNETRSSSRDEVGITGKNETRKSGRDKSNDGSRAEVKKSSKYKLKMSGKVDTRNISRDDMKQASRVEVKQANREEVQQASRDTSLNGSKDKTAKKSSDQPTNESKNKKESTKMSKTVTINNSRDEAVKGGSEVGMCSVEKNDSSLNKKKSRNESKTNQDICNTGHNLIVGVTQENLVRTDTENNMESKKSAEFMRNRNAESNVMEIRNAQDNVRSNVTADIVDGSITDSRIQGRDSVCIDGPRTDSDNMEVGIKESPGTDEMSLCDLKKNKRGRKNKIINVSIHKENNKDDKHGDSQLVSTDGDKTISRVDGAVISSLPDTADIRFQTSTRHSSRKVDLKHNAVSMPAVSQSLLEATYVSRSSPILEPQPHSTTFILSSLPTPRDASSRLVQEVTPCHQHTPSPPSNMSQDGAPPPPSPAPHLFSLSPDLDSLPDLPVLDDLKTRNKKRKKHRKHRGGGKGGADVSSFDRSRTGSADIVGEIDSLLRRVTLCRDVDITPDLSCRILPTIFQPYVFGQSARSLELSLSTATTESRRRELLRYRRQHPIDGGTAEERTPSNGM